ncbi:MAG: hypothetical protein JWP85_2159 [Rhodoglobus sp.]|nr:hypothetical protein [Rhodoglobus sp.]
MGFGRSFTAVADDQTRITNQPALTTSTGRSWLIIGALFTGISLGVLVPMTALPPAGVALVAAVAVAVLYIGMLVVRATVPPGRRRLGLMAAGLLAIAAISLVATGVVAFTAAA